MGEYPFMEDWLVRLAHGAETLSRPGKEEAKQEEKRLTGKCVGRFLLDGEDFPCNKNGQSREYGGDSNVGPYCDTCWAMYQSSRRAIEEGKISH